MAYIAFDALPAEPGPPTDSPPSSLHGRSPASSSVPPIHRLAAETLMQIFHDVAEEDIPIDAPGCAHSRSGWYSLAWVCARWRRIVHGDCILWANNYSHSLRRAMTALRLSGTIPLVYELSGDMPKIAMAFNLQSDASADLAFSYITPLERCRYIRVADGRADVIQHIARLAELSARVRLPVLEELRLETISYLWAGNEARMLSHNLKAFTIYCDKLRQVRFVNCYTTVVSPVLERYLLAFDSFYQVRPSIECLYNGLSPMASGALTELELLNATNGDRYPSTFSYSADTLHFPKLQKLRVKGYTQQVAEVLRVVSWPQRGTRVRVRVVTGDGEEESSSDQMLILSLAYPRGASWRILRAEHYNSNPVFELTVLETWQTRPPRTRGVPDTQVVFEAGGRPCAWWHTVQTALPLMGESDIQVFYTLLQEEDYYKEGIPWAEMLSSMTGLRAMHPWHQIMGSAGPVQEGGALGAQFQERVVGLTYEHV